ncbi:MAG: hypothetical protein ACOCRX_08190 [Candidatus Woesearchaeota archaeon]
MGLIKKFTSLFKKDKEENEDIYNNQIPSFENFSVDDKDSNSVNKKSLNDFKGSKNNDTSKKVNDFFKQLSSDENNSIEDNNSKSFETFQKNHSKNQNKNMNKFNPKLKSDSKDVPKKFQSNKEVFGNKKFIPNKSELTKRKNLDYEFPKELGSNESSSILDDKLEKRNPYSINSPLFIDVKTYDEILHRLDESKTRITNCDKVKLNLTENLDEQSKRYDSFRDDVEEIQRRLLKIDKKLFDN